MDISGRFDLFRLDAMVQPPVLVVFDLVVGIASDKTCFWCRSLLKLGPFDRRRSMVGELRVHRNRLGAVAKAGSEAIENSDHLSLNTFEICWDIYVGSRKTPQEF